MTATVAQPVEDFYLRTDADCYSGLLLTLEDAVRALFEHDTPVEPDFMAEYTSQGYQYLGSVPGKWFYDDIGTLVIDRLKIPLGKLGMVVLIVLQPDRRFLFAEPKNLVTGDPNTPDVGAFRLARLAA